ncbi:MAG: metal-sulfur cluster assembly factor [Pseudothermotoga sp.]
MVTKDEVLKALSNVIDFELGLDVVSLGLVYDIDVDQQDNVTVTMTMTTPACPLAGMILQDAEDKIREIKGVKDVKINLTFDPPWTPDRMNEELRKRFGI